MYNSETPSKAQLPGTGQLIRSTLLAMTGACLLLILFVLPAEYAIDPTGIGKNLGLTELAQVSRNNSTESLTFTSTASDEWRDEVSVTIEGYGQLELKLTMAKGDNANFEWFTDGKELDSDLHGDGAADRFISYREASGESQHSGNLTAAFDGTHGWYWQNRQRGEIKVTLRTNGTYGEIKRVM